MIHALHMPKNKISPTTVSYRILCLFSRSDLDFPGTHSYETNRQHTPVLRLKTPNLAKQACPRRSLDILQANKKVFTWEPLNDLIHHHFLLDDILFQRIHVCNECHKLHMPKMNQMCFVCAGGLIPASILLLALQNLALWPGLPWASRAGAMQLKCQSPSNQGAKS